MSDYILNIKHTDSFPELCIENLSLNQKKWYGQMALLIFQEAQKLNEYQNHKSCQILLNKKKLQTLFIQITQLYHYAAFRHCVDKDLLDFDLTKADLQVAKSLLLFIRMNSIHLSQSQLESYYCEEFSCFDSLTFNKCLHALESHKLIQRIWVSEDMSFFDKNTEPHNHLFFKEKQRLVDCNIECFKLLNSPVMEESIQFISVET